jgi:hypothetical protein
MPLYSVAITSQLFNIRVKNIYDWLKDCFKGVNRFAVPTTTIYCIFSDRPGSNHITRSILQIEEVLDRSSLSDPELVLLFESYSKAEEYDVQVCEFV